MIRLALNYFLLQPQIIDHYTGTRPRLSRDQIFVSGATSGGHSEIHLILKFQVSWSCHMGYWSQRLVFSKTNIMSGHKPRILGILRDFSEYGKHRNHHGILCNVKKKIVTSKIFFLRHSNFKYLCKIAVDWIKRIIMIYDLRTSNKQSLALLTWSKCGDYLLYIGHYYNLLQLPFVLITY